MHDVVIAIVAAVVVVGGGGGAGVLAVRRRRIPKPGLPAAPPAQEPAAGILVEEPGETEEPLGPPGAPAAAVGEAPAEAIEAETAEEVPAETAEEAPAETVGEAPAPAEAIEAETAEEVPGGVAEAALEDRAGVPDVEAPERPRLRDRLAKARSLLGGHLVTVRSQDRIDESTWEELEETLILADVGAETAMALLDGLRERARAEHVERPERLVELLRDELVARLAGDRSLRVEPGATNVWLFVGVNGVGKTTTIGKLGLQQRRDGRSVLMAAGDTFRAAAADQLAVWAERVGVEVVRGNEGGDPGAVIFDAVQHAAARQVDLVLADTAGRFHNRVNLMEELRKVRRVAERPPGKVTEVLLVLDATTGQNGLTQAKLFAEAVGVTGVVLTKLDGTAKGGIVLAVQTDLGIPIKLVGVGERPEDLVAFDPAELVDAIVAPDGPEA